MDYQKIHDRIINRARSENRVKGGEVYYEAHHIIPRCLGGNGKVHQWKHHPNIILLTVKEHRLVHACLHLLHPSHNGLALAYVKMYYGNKAQSGRKIVPAKMYEQARQLASKEARNARLGKTYEEIMGLEKANRRRKQQSEKLTGRNHTEESLQRMKKPKPTGFGEKISSSLKNRTFSDSTLEKMRKKCKPISQYSLTGEFIREWSSAREIQSQLGICSGNLPKACREGRTLKGYCWKYKK